MLILQYVCLSQSLYCLVSFHYGNKPAFDGANYTFLEQSFAAVSTIAICAGGLMGLPLVVSDYRNRKILKRYKVTPISPVMILLVQVTIYTLYSLISLSLIYVVTTFLILKWLAHLESSLFVICSCHVVDVQYWYDGWWYSS